MNPMTAPIIGTETNSSFSVNFFIIGFFPANSVEIYMTKIGEFKN